MAEAFNFGDGPRRIAEAMIAGDLPGREAREMLEALLGELEAAGLLSGEAAARVRAARDNRTDVSDMDVAARKVTERWAERESGQNPE